MAIMIMIIIVSILSMSVVTGGPDLLGGVPGLHLVEEVEQPPLSLLVADDLWLMCCDCLQRRLHL